MAAGGHLISCSLDFWVHLYFLLFCISEGAVILVVNIY